MLFFGFFVRELHGEIGPQIMEIGKIPIDSFCRWRDKGIWKEILEQLIDDPDYEWLIIDANHIKVHPHAAGAIGGNQDMNRTKGGTSFRGCIWFVT